MFGAVVIVRLPILLLQLALDHREYLFQVASREAQEAMKFELSMAAGEGIEVVLDG
jgi:hypothetical protein